jgi:D-aminoacyl-tRNA deacylase
MIAVVQRVAWAKVEVGGRVVGEVGPGLLVLASVYAGETAEEIAWTTNKIVSLRIFRQGEKHFDVDVRESGGGVLLVSNFTVAAATRRGRRPSFDGAAPPEEGRKGFDQFVEAVRGLGVRVETGEFGADMLVSSANDGPATFIVDSRGED